MVLYTCVVTVIIQAYKRILEADVNDKVAVWMNSPDEKLPWDEWSVLFYKRQLLRMVVYYCNKLSVRSISYDRAIAIFSHAWNVYTLQPGTPLGNWMAPVICGPITQASLDSIHMKTLGLAQQDSSTDTNAMSLIFTGKRLHGSDPLMFKILESDAVTELTSHERAGCDWIVSGKNILFFRPLTMTAIDILVSTKLLPLNIPTMLMWSPNFTTQQIQQTFQDMLNSCSSSKTHDNWYTAAARLMSNMVTHIGGKISAINRSNISEHRDIISNILFEMPSRHILRGDETMRKIGSSAGFFMGLPHNNSGVNYNETSVTVTSVKRHII